jgi:hypothetical protein
MMNYRLILESNHSLSVNHSNHSSEVYIVKLLSLQGSQFIANNQLVGAHAKKIRIDMQKPSKLLLFQLP